MSNPLLRPNERFQRPALVDAEGRGLFADNQSSEQTTAADQQLPYQPRYVVTHGSRAPWTFMLTLAGFVATLGFAIPFFSDAVVLGITLGLLGVVVSVIASLRAYDELQGIAAGAIDPAGRTMLLWSYVVSTSLGVLGIGAFLGILVLVLQGVLELDL